MIIFIAYSQGFPNIQLVQILHVVIEEIHSHVIRWVFALLAQTNANFCLKKLFKTSLKQKCGSQKFWGCSLSSDQG